MKIAHIGLAAFYTEGMTYQDNQLAEQNARDGHQVMYISNAAKYENGVIVETGYEDTVLESGVRLVRLPYVRIINSYISTKLRKVRGLYALLEDFGPDVILSHDICHLSVFELIRYKKEHPGVKFYADCHSDAGNSAMNWVSVNIQHRMLYRYLCNKAYPWLDSYFCVARSCMDFVHEYYGLPKDKLEFYPLGGNILSDEEYSHRRERAREALGVHDGETVFVHSGKLVKEKRTEDLLRAFAAVPELRARLFVCGSVPDDTAALLMPLIEEDSRVEYLGWKNSDELLELLCACDMYLQPGTQSATMQNAVCCRSALMLYPHRSYKADYDSGNILWVETREDMELAFRKIEQGHIKLNEMSESSKKFASEKLDYRKLAARLYE